MVDLDQHQDHFSSVSGIKAYSSIAIGPGLGQHPDSVKALEQLLQVVEKPLVIDADALNLIAANKDLLKRIPPRSILTPHPKEFDRIAGESTNSYERLKKAPSFRYRSSTLRCLERGLYSNLYGYRKRLFQQLWKSGYGYGG